jgi:porphobilinogen synthase
MSERLLLTHRPRRLRQSPRLRSLVEETTLRTTDLIWPLFIIEGEKTKTDIAAMPGVERLTIDLAIKAAEEAAKYGIPALALFPNIDPSKRNEQASEATNPNNLICRALKAIKQAVPEIGLIADVALDPYTSHGHDGLIDEHGHILNDKTVAILREQARVQAEAGADIIAPSDMMDGRIGAIREHLDEHNLEQTLIMAYAAKYASSFYGPFRDAVGTNKTLKGDKRTYQMNPANTDEAIREVELDLSEGADMVMVKPGLPYLDILHRVKTAFAQPTFAYQVSGEYSMIKAAAAAGYIDEQAAMMETLLAFKRAGADGILSYFALDAAKILS